MTTYTLHDRPVDEYREITVDQATAISHAATLHTGPWGAMGCEIDRVLYCTDDEDGEIDILAVRYAGRWLFVPPGQEPHVSSELARSYYQPPRAGDTGDISTYSTTYTDDDGDHVAIQIPWPATRQILGYDHDGSAEDDETLIAALLEAGAPAWVKDAPGWLDEHGWGLIGPLL